MQLKKFTTEVKKWSIFLTCWFLSLILFYTVLGVMTIGTSCRGVARLSKMRGGCKGGSWGWLGLKMAALHRPLYKVSFHLGGAWVGRGLVFDRGGSSPPAYIPDKLNAQLEYSILHSNISIYICLWLLQKVLRGHNWVHFAHRLQCTATLNLNVAILKTGYCQLM